MADLWQPRTPPWIDGEGATADNFANRVEQGLERIDVALDAVEDRVTALEANSGTAVGANALVVTSANRGTPTEGRIVFDRGLQKFIGGYGSAWKNLDGTPLTTSGGNPPPGTGTAPTGMTAVVNPDNSIQLTWNPVSGATSYKLYELRSPNGVTGAEALTTTSSLRTPSSSGNYEYWVTALVAGVESAASNHAACTLPYGSTPGGGGGGSGGTSGTPAQLLALGAGGGKWNLGVGYPSGHVDIDPATLEGGWTEAPYFYVNEAGTKVHFQVPMNGAKTSTNTKYPRVELREYIGGSKAAWSGSSGTHLMSGKTTMLHMEDSKPEGVIAQIHDGSDDTLQLRYNNKTELRASINGTLHPTVLGNFPWGTEVAWEIKVANGTLTIKINGTTKITTNPGYGSGQYFKVGIYAQQNVDNGNPPNGYQSCELRDLVVLHS
jgi:alginate lyase